METSSRKVIILAGPNGAGKSTSAAKLLLGPLQVTEYVNADTIAHGLSAFAPDRVAIEAGRVMLRRLDELAAERASFAFETTLATRSYAKRLTQLKAAGYEVHLLYLWLASPELAIARVAERVRQGGHDIPADVIRRRYTAGLRNLLTLYLPLANSWQLIDNTRVADPLLIAAGRAISPTVFVKETWDQVVKEFGQP